MMKAKMNIKRILLVVVISLSSLFLSNISFASSKGIITVETARLREKPDTSSEILELISIKEEVEILENSGEWCKIKYKNFTGYLKTDLLKIEEEKEEISNQDNKSEIKDSESNEVTDGVATDYNIQENEDNTEKAESEEDQQGEIKNENGQYKVIQNVNIKITPLIYSLEIGTIQKEQEIQVTNIMNNWAYITTEKITGWVRLENLEKIDEQNTNIEKTAENKEEPEQKENKTEAVVEEQQVEVKMMYVNVQTVNVREEANKTSAIVTQLSINTEVQVLSEKDAWYYIEVSGKKGYILGSLLSTTKQPTSRSSMNDRGNTTQTTINSVDKQTKQEEEGKTKETQKVENNNSTIKEATTGSIAGSSIVSYAEQFLGTKYVYGGTTTNGFDCSGFTQYVYKHFGISINRTAAEQYSNGNAVTELQAGDLVMFGKSGINHVGIYIGGNTFIHAANPEKGVTKDTMATGYYKTNYVGARRVI